MAGKSSQTKSVSESGKRRSRRWFIFLLLLLPVLLVSGVVLGARALYRVWFTENRRMVLRQIDVSSTGYWKNREEMLLRRLDLHRGVPVFKINPEFLRERIEHIPCVESARIYRVLPDTLNIELTERVPRAFIGAPGSMLVADENAVVMLSRESLAQGGKLQLPVITGVGPAGMSPGEPEKRLSPALELIMLTVRRYPMFRIRAVSIISSDLMVCYLFYRDGRTCYRVEMPIRSRGTDFLLSVLESTIIEIRRTGDSRSNINLTYDGQVVVK